MNYNFNNKFQRDIYKFGKRILDEKIDGYTILRDILMELSNEERRELLSDLLHVNYHSDTETILNELKYYI